MKTERTAQLQNISRILHDINGVHGALVKCKFCKGNVGRIIDPKVMREYRQHGLCEKCQGEIAILW